ncbi:MAG: GntR family transcriptional regulator [Desulfobacterota bacterium]|nr:GntR family transcriptional regulator [Thermodesulfobacteriota bacterium]
MENLLGGLNLQKRKPLREVVYEALKRSILHGKLKGNQRLVEEALARQMGISRTPVREAFHKLEQDDLIRRLPRGGFAVREFTKEDVEEIFGIRIALESYAAYLATIHMTPDDLSALEKKITESETAFKEGDDKKAVRLFTEFHDLLYRSCKSRKLIEMIHGYRDYFFRYRSALLHTRNGFKSSVSDHRQMLDAMKKKEPRLVESLVRAHLERGREIILKEIREGRLIP